MPAPLPIRMWGAEKDAPPIPWAEVERRLQDAIAYWVVTAAGSRPVWGVWLDDRLLLSIGSSVITRGIDESPIASVHLEDAHDVVIVEGTVRWVSDEETLQPFFDVYNPKYAWDFAMDSMVGRFAALRPTVILAWKAGAPADAKTDPFPLAASHFVFGEQGAE